MELLKHIMVIGSITFATAASAQISTGKQPEPEKQEEQPVRVKRVPTDGMDEFAFYIGAGRVWANRDLTPNDAPFGAPLGVRADETSLKAWSFQAGVRNRFAKWFSYDVGFALDRFGESYAYDDPNSDSTMNYTSRYSYFSVPVQLYVTYGKDFRFFLGGGFQPELLTGYRRVREWTTTLNSTGDDKLKRADGLNGFNLGLLASAGFQWRLGKWTSVYCTPTWTWNMLSTYDKQSDYIHKASSFNLKFGLVIHLPETTAAN